MIGIENVDKLTPDLLNDLFQKSVDPTVLDQFNKAIRCWGIASAGHFVCMSKYDIKNDLQLYQESGFSKYILNEYQKVKKSYNIFKLIKFLKGKWLFNKTFRDVQVQFYSYLCRSKDLNHRLASEQVYIQQQMWTSFFEDTEVLDRMKSINEELLLKEKRERILKRDSILLTVDYHRFMNDFTSEQLSEFSLRLTDDRQGLINSKYKDGVHLLFGAEVSDEMDLNLPIVWKHSGPELMYLFYCLEEFKLIPNSELKKISSHVAENFTKSDGQKFKEKSLSDVSGRLKFGSRKVFEIQKTKGKRYSLIYDIVKNVAKR